MTVLLAELIAEGDRVTLNARITHPSIAACLPGDVARPRRPAHPRLFIWGPLEARLQQPDVVILGSLNEGVWPRPQEASPWLSRLMRDAARAAPARTPHRLVGSRLCASARRAHRLSLSRAQGGRRADGAVALAAAAAGAGRGGKARAAHSRRSNPLSPGRASATEPRSSRRSRHRSPVRPSPRDPASSALRASSA